MSEMALVAINNLFQTCSSGKMPKLAQRAITIFHIDTESDFSCENSTLCRFFLHQSVLTLNGMQEKTIVRFVSDYNLCFQKPVKGHD